MTSLTDLTGTGGVFGLECDDEEGPPNGTEDAGRGDGSVSTGDTIMASEGESVCCIAREGTGAGWGTGVWGRRLCCFGDRDPISSGAGDSSTNLRFLPPWGDIGCAGCSGASER